MELDFEKIKITLAVIYISPSKSFDNRSVNLLTDCDKYFESFKTPSRSISSDKKTDKYISLAKEYLNLCLQSELSLLKCHQAKIRVGNQFSGIDWLLMVFFRCLILIFLIIVGFCISPINICRKKMNKLDAF